MNNVYTPTREDLFCTDLPTRPVPGVGKILITGASGYIGGRLVNELLARGYQVRVIIRENATHYQELWPQAEIVVADALKYETLQHALNQIDTAFYLIHSLLLGQQQFYDADITAAHNFREAARINNVKRIIYLGGLGDAAALLSEHLRGRIHVSEELQKGPVPVTILRAATIMGSGSASYEIIKHLIKKVPVISVPKWANTRCQPIAIRDVIKYLVGCLENPATAGKSFDIGGQDILTYRQMLEIFAEITGIKRLFFRNPFSRLRFYAYIASLVTPVPAPIIQSLMEGLKNEVVCTNDDIKKFIPFATLSYREAVKKALWREEQDKVYTRWSDAYPKDHSLAMKLSELGRIPYYTTTYSILTDKSAEALYASICRIGGKEGWFQNNWMWRLRGIIDSLLMGVGSSRGRRSDVSLKINDVIDFWRVEDIKTNKRL
ncbi:MAG: DUF2867 domain-containing protein, partial [Proteobacteria bacterium]|nr:DUF2867 domain-containing protein [Pseudomonadota bacterium]